ncbi:hypothetical protein Tco_0805804 [Tanacetum coccineum]
MPVQTRRQLATDPEMCMFAAHNKKDEDQTVIRNKARLVAKGYAQEERGPEYVALSASCAQVMWMKEHASDYGFNYQQNTIVLRLSVSICNIMQPRTAFANEAHPYSADMFTKAVPEDRFKYLSEGMVMRCFMTPSDLEVSDKYTA